MTKKTSKLGSAPLVRQVDGELKNSTVFIWRTELLDPAKIFSDMAMGIFVSKADSF